MTIGLTPKQQTMQRLGQLKAERASWWAHYQDITTYLLPRQGRYFRQDRNKGWKRNQSIFDNTGTRSLYTLAAGLMGGLTSPARPWFRLGVRDDQLMQLDTVKNWCSEVTGLMHQVFQRSNTYRALSSMYLELGAFGTAACVVVEDFENVIHCYPLTCGEYCIATDWKGQVCTLYREFEKTVGEVVKEFGKENCSRRVQTMYERGSLDQWIPIVHAIEPREDRDLEMADNLNMSWRSVYYEIGGDGDQALRESGYKRFNVLAPRWDVAGGDIYGNSPGMEALGDIKQLQQEQLRKSQGIDYMTNPPLQVPTSLKNRDLDRLPGGVTYRDMTAGSDKIESMFEVRLDLQHLLADMQDVRARIRASFYADMFLMLQNDVRTDKTATEVAELHEEKMLMLGPVLERLHNELLNPLIDITFDYMLDAGLIPPPPDELQGADLNVELISMLAQAQRAIATNSVDRFVNNVLVIAQARPEILDKLDVDQYAELYSDMLGVDPKFLMPEDKVAAVRQARAKAQQQAAQAAQMEQAATAANKLGNTPTQGGSSTGLDDVIAQFSGYTSQGV